MKGDFTRDTFNWHKGYSQVLMQQGRVQLDADFNEQSAILLHCLRAVVKDFVGPYGGPVNSGFKITPDPNNKGDFKIGAGRYYVDGILCEIGNAEDLATDTSYSAVKLYGNSTMTAGRYLVYLDVWERFVNYLDDDTIRESALGGPDTAGRAQVLCQVKTTAQRPKIVGANEGFEGDEPIPTAFKCANVNDYWPGWVDIWQPKQRGSLAAQVVDPDGDNIDPCITSPDAQYRGDTNRLYRVEVHQAGKAGEATFKWSRENGSVVTAWLKSEGSRIIVRDARGFVANQWVELTNDDFELSGTPGLLVKVINVEDDALTVDVQGTTSSTLSDFEKTLLGPPNLDKYPKVRRWDQIETETIHLRADDQRVYGDVSLEEDKWLTLEDGIQIYFNKAHGKDTQHIYRSGDYWVIPARVATGGIEWPTNKDGNAQALPPFGTSHHYAPIGLITVLNDDGNLDASTVDDCRTCFLLTTNKCN